MKSKKSLYILIPLVVVVWGIIIFRVLNMTGNPEINNVLEFHVANDTDAIVFEKPKKLLLNYADPFLKNLPKAEKQSKNSGYVSLFNNNPEPKIKEIDWPEVNYQGIIENKNKKVAIIKINDKKYLVSNGQNIKEMRVEGLYKDSIIFEKNKEIKTFYK